MKIYQTRAIPKELSRLPLYPPSYSSRLSQAPPELAITPVHLPSTHAVSLLKFAKSCVPSL